LYVGNSLAFYFIINFQCVLTVQNHQNQGLYKMKELTLEFYLFLFWQY